MLIAGGVLLLSGLGVGAVEQAKTLIDKADHALAMMFLGAVMICIGLFGFLVWQSVRGR